MKTAERGFTLIEVLLALAVIAISLTALLKATAQNVSNTQRIKEKTLSHWIAMQGISSVQLGLISVTTGPEITEVTVIAGQRWYWRIKATDSRVKSVQKITITVSKNQSGPFSDPLIGFRFVP